MTIKIVSIIALFVCINTYSISQTPLTVAENFNIKTPEGETINLYNILESGQSVVIDFFSITCGPCQIFAPHIQTSSTHYGNNNEEVFFVGISYSGDNNSIIVWDSTYGITYPTVSGSQGGGSGVHLNYEVLSLPTIVLITPDKNIVGQLFLPDFTPATHVIDSMLMANDLFPVITEIRNDNQKQQIHIYPNPINTRATVEFDVIETNQLEIELVNLLGHQVYRTSEMPLQTGKQIIDLSFENIAKGIYILNITDNKSIFYNQKVVLE